ncbi:ABC1 family-domain-containing protein [Lipomyces oligophaga]|uniref:ABC1 family-domain-containing protein n=1 Tax=Lipomyces oligophaga TaxID=45792 RepID=UPI0034CFAD69
MVSFSGRLVFRQGARLWSQARQCRQLQDRISSRAGRPSSLRTFTSRSDRGRDNFHGFERDTTRLKLETPFVFGIVGVGYLAVNRDPDISNETAFESVKPVSVTLAAPNRQKFLHNKIMKTVKELICSFLDSLGTFTRFTHLVVIFLPVIVTSPAILIGSRYSPSDSETSGAVWWYKVLIWSMQAAGPTFIKLGQWAASRTDIFPRRFCIEMSKLHSNVREHSYNSTKRAINNAFAPHGLSFDQVFDEFDPAPLGIGAIAQVYRARLSQAVIELTGPTDDFTTNDQSNNGPWVAVKVLHPHVEIRVHRDLQIMMFFANLLNKIPTIEWLSLPGEVDQFGKMMRSQMDLRIESHNLSTFRNNFAGREGIHFPVSFSDELSDPNDPTTQRVLIEEYVTAIPMGKFLSLPAEGRVETEELIADMGLNAFLNMLLIDNFVHADLHPGNIMVRFIKPHRTIKDKFFLQTLTDTSLDSPEAVADTNAVTGKLLGLATDPHAFRAELQQLSKSGYRPEIVFLDAGLVTTLDDVNRRNFLDLFTALATFDGYRAGKLMIERSRTPATVINSEDFALRMKKMLQEVKQKTFSLGNIKVGDLLNEVLTMVRRHHVRMEGDFINVVLSVLLLEGIGRQLDPNLDIFKSSLPILRKLGTLSAMSGNTALLKDKSTTSMVKVWFTLEARQFVTESAQDIIRLVKFDKLTPNY